MRFPFIAAAVILSLATSGAIAQTPQQAPADQGASSTDDAAPPPKVAKKPAKKKKAAKKAKKMKMDKPAEPAATE